MSNIAYERFYGQFRDLPAQFLHRLDRMFELVTRTPGPYAVASAYTFSDTDAIDSLQVDANAAALTINLPPSPSGKRRRRVIKTDASANAVTVSGNGYNINGSASVALATQYDFIEVEPTGAEWLIVGGSLSVLP